MANQAKHWKQDDFEIGPIVGKGSFGKVVLAKVKNHDYICALKYDTRHGSRLEKWLRELKIPSLLRHPNVLRTLGYFNVETNQASTLVIIMEYAPCGSLDKIINCHRSKYMNGFEEPIASNIIRQVMSGVDYCHDQDVIHRDIKLENIMVGYDGTIKVGDFGLANFCTDSDWRETYCGTGEYMAPEIIERKPYDKSVDNWSVGVLAYELMCGYTPFLPKEERHRDDRNKLCQNIINLTYKMPGHFSKTAQSFIRGFLQLKPQDRKSFKQAITDPWIVNVPEFNLTDEPVESTMTDGEDSLHRLVNNLSVNNNNATPN